MNSGTVVALNGVPRSGKSAIAVEIMRLGTGKWSNHGVDSVMGSTPAELQPGIGLRPGGERPELESFVLASYCELFDLVATTCGAGGNVVVDVGIHDGYTQPLDIWGEMHRRLAGLDMLLVGVHCSLAVLRRRRAATGYLSWDRTGRVPAPVMRWQEAVHVSKSYDLEVDTSTTSAAECAREILAHWE